MKGRNKMNTKTCSQTRASKDYRVFPFNVNMHDSLFGGTLAAWVDECASISVTRFARSYAVTASIDSFDYHAPLHGGVTATVETYVTGRGTKSVEVFCKVLGEDPLTGERFLASTSFWTFVLLGEIASELPVLVPESDEEMMICQGYALRRQIQQEKRKQHKKIVTYIDLGGV